MKSLVILILLFLTVSCSRSADDFDLCGIGFMQPYYFTSLEYEGGFYAIKEKYHQQYQAIKEGNNSGVVKILFYVNCRGEAGEYKMETYDFNYQKTDLNPNLTSQLMSITKQLNQWIPGKDEGGNTVNSLKFLAFRIVNGEITEIMPK